MFFRSSWFLGLSSMMSLTIFRMMHDFFSTEFSVWLYSSSFSCERIWFSIKISIFTWSVCVSCFGYEAVIRTSLDAFSEVRLRWHHRCRNVFKSSCLACIYVNIFCAYVLPRIWFLWCFCCYMSLQKSCGCWFSFAMSTWCLIFRVWNNDYIFQLKFFAEYVWLWSMYFRCFQTYL